MVLSSGFFKNDLVEHDEPLIFLPRMLEDSKFHSDSYREISESQILNNKKPELLETVDDYCFITLTPRTMTYIKTDIPQPGIVELLFYKGPTGKALSNLAQTLLHGPSGLTPGERELIASYVSDLNDCEFCHESHSASANAHLKDGGRTVQEIKLNPDKAPVSDKMKTLLKIAAKVQKSGREVKMEDISAAKQAGATDEEIHDSVLIAAAFCMYNRYVDGLGTFLPADKKDYVGMGKMLATKGYKYPPLFLRKFVVRSMRKNAVKLKTT